MKVYIAGPMRNIPQFGFDRFDAAKARAEALGLEAVSPADLDRKEGFEGLGKLGIDSEWTSVLTKKDVIQRDIEALYTCDALALLPGWERSTGTRVELALALFLGLPILDATNFQPYDAMLVGFQGKEAVVR